jgi:transmembrane sensor
MDANSKISAEELLAKENFSEQLLSQCAKHGVIDEEEIRITQKIYTVLNSPSEEMISFGKDQTKNQIKHSVRKLKTKRLLVRLSVAATLLLAAIITTVGFLRVSPTTDIVNFAQAMTNIKGVNETRIILQNGKEIRVDKKQSQIRYDVKGENIIINSDQKVAQKMDNSKVVFNTVIVPYGKRTQIFLSDGTKVWLNSGSKLVYPVVFTENKREVYIDGEAVFDVVHLDGKSFVVSTRDFDIKVLGTVFNVCAYSDDQVSGTVLAQGKIELVDRGTSLLTQTKLIMSPGTMALFNHDQGTFEQRQVNPEKYLSWRDGYLIFNSEKLENILRKLSRYYNIEMIIADNQLRSETFSGYLDLKNSPEEVLSVISETTSINYSKDHEKIFINPK